MQIPSFNWGRGSWRRKWNHSQYPCLKFHDREAWWATVQGLEWVAHDLVTNSNNNKAILCSISFEASVFSRANTERKPNYQGHTLLWRCQVLEGPDAQGRGRILSWEQWLGFWLLHGAQPWERGQKVEVILAKEEACMSIRVEASLSLWHHSQIIKHTILCSHSSLPEAVQP